MYGSRLKYFIERSGLSQQEISNKTDIPASSLSYFLRQELPSLEAIVKICECLHVPLTVFFSDTDKDYTLMENERQLIKLFKKLPVEVQTNVMRMVGDVLDAFLAGKSGKKH